MTTTKSKKYNNLSGAEVVGLGLAAMAVFVVVFFGAIAVLAVAVMLLWNAVVTDIWNVPELGFWSAMGLMLLTRLMLTPFSFTSVTGSKKDD